MSVIECNSCDKGPCRMVESVTIDGEWLSICTRGVYDGYAEWTRLKEKKDMLIIRQPEAMKKEIQEFLASCMNTGSGSKNLELIQTVTEIIDQYTKRVGGREKVLDKLCKICPFLDERPDSCENCVVETVRKELHKVGDR